MLSRSTVQYMIDKYEDVVTAKGKQEQQQMDLFNVSSSSIDENQCLWSRLRSRMN